VAPAQAPGDLPDPGALVKQVVHQHVVLAAALCHRAAGLRNRGRVGKLADRHDGAFLQAALVPGDAAFDGLGEVLPQMEPVGDLHRVRRAGTGSL
jgi:hypothetical protein